MAEVAGLALGAISLVSLFTLSVDCVHYVQDGFSREQDLEWARGQLYAYRIRLYSWGKACGLLREEGYDKRLDNPNWKEHIRVQLTVIVRLFLDAGKISRAAIPTPDAATETALMLRPSNAATIQARLRSYLCRVRARPSSEGRFLAALRYGFFEKKRLSELLQKLDKSVEALELVTRDLDLFEKQRHFVEIEVESVSDPSLRSSLASVGQADEMMNLISETASGRVALLPSRQHDHQSQESCSRYKSSNEASTAFFSAPSQLIWSENDAPPAGSTNQENSGCLNRGSNNIPEGSNQDGYELWISSEEPWQFRHLGRSIIPMTPAVQAELCRSYENSFLGCVQAGLCWPSNMKGLLVEISHSLTSVRDGSPMVFVWNNLPGIPSISRGSLRHCPERLSFIKSRLRSLFDLEIRRFEQKFLFAGDRGAPTRPSYHEPPKHFYTAAQVAYKPFWKYAGHIDARFRKFINSGAKPDELSTILCPAIDRSILIEHQLRLLKEGAFLGMHRAEIKTTHEAFAGGLATVIGRDLTPDEWVALKASLKNLKVDKLGCLYWKIVLLFVNMLLSHTIHTMAGYMHHEVQALPQERAKLSPQVSRNSLEAGPTALDPAGWGLELTVLKRIDNQMFAGLPADMQGWSKGVRKRLVRDIRMIPEEPFLTARFVEHKSFHLRLSFVGPPQSLYRGGIFHLGYQFPEDYPFRPPTVRFLTRVYHPNISHTGEICVSTLTLTTDDGFTPYTSIWGVALSIISLLVDPFPDDPLVPEIAATFISDPKTFESNARACTKKYAGVDQSYPELGVLPEYFAKQTGEDGLVPEQISGAQRTVGRGKQVEGRVG